MGLGFIQNECLGAKTTVHLTLQVPGCVASRRSLNLSSEASSEKMAIMHI